MYEHQFWSEITSFAKYLWPNSEEWISGKDLFIRVLSNLFNNAQDALQESKRKSIHISADIISGEKKLLIKDTGTGIKSGDLDKIYDISFTTKKNGYGIGLSFCKQSLEKMGIELSCHSVYNNFTEFCLNFSAE